MLNKIEAKQQMEKLKQYFNADLIYTGLNQLWKLISGPISLILIPLFLTQEEQGYWYTFSGLAALIVLADLGFSNLVLQFAAHEFAVLKFNRRREIVGEAEHVIKLASFFTFSLKWALTLMVLAFPFILCTGWYLLSQQPTELSWKIPWTIYVLASVLAFLNNTLLWFFEGCDCISTVQKIRISTSIVMVFLMWGGLIIGTGLYALSYAMLLSTVSGSILILWSFKPAIWGFVQEAKRSTYSWLREFSALLWKYALSWISGYFIFQMYTPLMFHFFGAVEAGKVGLSISLWSAIFSLATVWIYVVTPKINIYAAKNEHQALNRILNNSLCCSSLTYLLGAAVVLFMMFYLQGKVPLVDRFVNPPAMFMLAGAWFGQVIIQGLAVYLRAHKEEPLVISSVVSALYIVITTLLAAKYLAPEYFFLGYFTSYFIGLPWAGYLFIQKRRSLRQLSLY